MGCADGGGIAVCSDMVDVTHNDGGVGGKVVARWWQGGGKVVARWEFGD